ncbi:MAG: hypothetical protein CVT67_08710 [Actinobacteria bacterium HGW-Actinobacteria-7]|jgi:hypothetical protein|nr:MAG: hypothetical protein CVT67_08710 [Actinobacteria bacterium HGW-Actinobacteria-7]
MAEKTKLTVPGDELSAEKLTALFDEAQVPVGPGPEGMNNIVVDMGGIPFLIDAHPEQHAIKIWTARELDPDETPYDLAVKSANAFNERFLLVRNFIYQDPADLQNYRAVWDHDRLVDQAGLSSAELVMTLTRVAEILHHALGTASDSADA